MLLDLGSFVNENKIFLNLIVYLLKYNKTTKYFINL